MMPLKKIKITILDDSEFYNRLLTKQLTNYTDVIAAQKNIFFEISSFINTVDFIANFKSDTDIAFVDFYLGNTTALEIIDRIKSKSSDCKIIVISQLRNTNTSIQTINKGAFEYIQKDPNALAKSCFIVEDIINSNGNRNWLFN